ncbi:Paraneoplastic antigen Ma1 [Merluccius polli]|uniref:Paraneoplastic antigen Ma1 n=1 Tax=Merluccius polli TaxID=89951 RepID=A0AA47M6R3_MERPO|nr:Paraneoplastic antigen Ma1 [Merluccius polli]
MDICNRFEVNGQSSLFVTGIGSEYTDEEINTVFEVNGDISKIVRIPDESGQPEGRALIQYASDRSISRIDPITLGTLPSPKDPAVSWVARTIRDVCQEEMGREIANRYLSELQSVAGSGRAGFLSVLQRELQGDQSTSHNVHTSATQPHATQDGNTPSTDQNEPAELTHVHSAPASVPVSPVHVRENVFNPPQIQKVIVEHVIRSESATSSSPQIRMRTFSGRMPRPNGEVDYETWRTQVDLLLDDSSLSDAHKVRRILESLLSPAADVVKPLGISSPPSVYVIQLDAAFGVVEDGEELFAAFLSSNQNNGEKPSAYLNRLHSLLTRAISRGGVSAGSCNDHLLRQFCRGCWDQSIIIGLQLECKRSNPPTFPRLPSHVEN